MKPIFCFMALPCPYTRLTTKLKPLFHGSVAAPLFQ